MEQPPFSRSLLVSTLGHAAVLCLLLLVLRPFLAPATPLMMELTLIGEMSKGNGLGTASSVPGEAAGQAPQAKTEGEFGSPQKPAANPQPKVSDRPEVAVHRPLKSDPNSGNAPSESYLESLDKTAPIGLAVRKKAESQVKTTAGLGHLGTAGVPEGSAQIEGELAARAVKNKVFPKYPPWAEQQGIEGSVKFKLTVLPNGLLKDDLELEQTSGYKEMDQAVYEALLQWEFEPLPPELPQADQSGVITFSFDLKQN